MVYDRKPLGVCILEKEAKLHMRSQKKRLSWQKYELAGKSAPSGEIIGRRKYSSFTLTFIFDKLSNGENRNFLRHFD